MSSIEARQKKEVGEREEQRGKRKKKDIPSDLPVL